MISDTHHTSDYDDFRSDVFIDEEHLQKAQIEDDESNTVRHASHGEVTVRNCVAQNDWQYQCWVGDQV